MPRFITIVAALPILIGCDRNRSKYDYPWCTAEGVVSVDGEALTSGTVTFIPTVAELSGGRPGLATIGSDGRYQLLERPFGKLSPVPPGEYIVTILSMSVPTTDGKPTPKLTSPAMYSDARTSPLRATLKPGQNSIDFSLTR